MLGYTRRLLVENADAYADPGGEVRVGARRVTPRVEIWVTNPGPPIPEDVRAHLFERFYRGRQPASGEHVGLGLAIADQMVRQMRGSRRVECGDGLVVFAVSLPGCSATPAERGPGERVGS